MLEPLKLCRVGVDPGERHDRSSSETQQAQAEKGGGQRRGVQMSKE
jgi:hypothetical protein